MPLGNRDEGCRQKCIDKGFEPGSPEYQECLRNCRAEEDAARKEREEEEKQKKTINREEEKPKGGNPCDGPGYLAPQIKIGPDKYVLAKKCAEGYKAVKAEDGRIWCCKKKLNGDDEKEEEEEEEGEVGEGCYKLADNPIKPGGGKLWKDNLITEEMGFYRPGNVQGHWVHKGGKWYTIEDIHEAIKRGNVESLVGKEGGACRKGYKRVMKDGEVYCCPDEGAGGGKDIGGEFKFSPELMEMLNKLKDRFQYLLDYPTGYTPEERQSLINYMTTSLKRGERGEIQSLRDRLAGIGLLGQPAEVGEISKLKRGTQENIASLKQRMAIDELEKKYGQMMGTTGMASNLFNVVSTIEQLQEALSAGRRSEGRELMQMLLQYLATSMGGGSNAYWQAILNSMAQNQGGGDIWDIIAYIPFLAK